MYKHILLPTDGSELSEKAVHEGVRFAKSVGAKVTGLYSAHEYEFVMSYRGEYDNDQMSEEEYLRKTRERSEKILAVVGKAAEEAGVPCELKFVPNNHPYEAITETAEASGCDLVFMASHGRRGLKGMLLGSETMKVLTHSEVPVLVVR